MTSSWQNIWISILLNHAVFLFGKFGPFLLSTPSLTAALAYFYWLHCIICTPVIIYSKPNSTFHPIHIPMVGLHILQNTYSNKIIWAIPFSNTLFYSNIWRLGYNTVHSFSHRNEVIFLFSLFLLNGDNAESNLRRISKNIEKKFKVVKVPLMTEWRITSFSSITC